jgi:hypothetical protein
MNIDELQRKLLVAARLSSPSDAVPYAFERRIMARIAGKPAVDLLALWNRALWQAAAPCIAVMLLLGVWTLFSLQTENSVETLAADLESAVYAPFDSLGENW